MKTLLILWGCAVAAWGQYSPAGGGVNRGSVLPATCNVGDGYFLTTAAAGQQLRSCIAADVWAVVVGQDANGNVAIGAMVLAPGVFGNAYTASGSIAVYSLVKLTTSGKVVSVSGAESILGVALATVTDGQSVNVAEMGLTTCIAEGSITDDHWLIAGTIDPTHCKDGGATLSVISLSTRTLGKARGAATNGQQLGVYVMSHRFGAQVQLSDVPAGGSSGNIQYNNAGVLSGAAISDCVAAGGIVQYTASTHTFSCHTLADADLPADIPVCTKYTVAYNDSSLNVAGTSATKTLATIPAKAQITSLRLKHSAQFTASGLTALTITLGDGTTSNIYAPSFSIFQAASATALYDDGGAFASTASSHSLVGTFTATAANLNTLTAGSVDVWACVRVLP